MTKSKKIVVWGCVDILTTAFEFLLAAKKDWKVVSISNEYDADALLLAVRSTQPDIVIIHQGNNDGEANLQLRLLQCHSAIKVITISLENNAMEVYTKKNILVNQTSDLISVIENES